MIHSEVHLQIPCYDLSLLQMMWFTKLHQTKCTNTIIQIQIIYQIIQSVEATGGVYKGQGRNQHILMIYAY